MPSNVPVNVFPVVIATITCLSANAETSVKNFLCATDNHLTPILPNEITKQLFKNDNSQIFAVAIFFP
jgi:hypothetical protein